MRRSLPSLLLTGAFILALATAPAGQKASPQEATVRQHIAAFDTASTEPVTVIVELSEAPAATAGRRAAAERAVRLNRIRTERGNVFSHLRRLGIAADPRHEFELAYNGFSLTLPASQLPLLAGVPGIVGVHPNPEVVRESLDDVELDVQPQLGNGVTAVRASAAWSGGYRGEGMLIAIIDDGVDYTHPDLGGCLGPGCKVIGGYDFVDRDADPQEGLTSGTRDFHGTHVASIAAGAKGVAPAANILAVRVLGTNPASGPTALDRVMAGIEFALRHDVDVINMSIGFQNTTSQSNNPYAVMTGNVVLSGVVWVNSNGNDGASGPYRPNMYGASPLVIATANADARRVPQTTLLATGEVLVGGGFFGSPDPWPAALTGTPLTVVDVGFGNTPAYYADKDVAGKVVIAARGGAAGEDAAFVNKANQARAAGAAGLIVSNNVAGDFTNTTIVSLPAYTVSQANGVKIRDNPLVLIEPFVAGPQVAPGSSRGPTIDLQIKPDVAAPGTAIVAAVPFEVSATGYASVGGTSMAAPHVAGAAVLLRQAHPDWTPQQVKLALMNTASTLSTPAGVMFRTIEQGAGFINIDRALAPALTASPGSVSFGQLLPADGYTATRNVAVNSPGTYDVGVTWVRSYTGVSASTSVSQIAGGPHDVALTVSIAPTAAAGEYEGYLTFTNASDAADVYKVPFLFAHGLAVTELRLSKTFARSSASNPDSVDVSFSVGRPLDDWYLGNQANTFRFTENQGPTAPGAQTVTWDVRQSNGGTLTGVFTLVVWYRLPGSATFVSSNPAGRLYIDNVAPLIAVDEIVPSVVEQSQITIRGAVGDTGMWSFGEVAGSVTVNGIRADLYPRIPAQIFTGNNAELAFEATVTLTEGENTITVSAEDAAGNRSQQTITMNTVLDTLPPVITFSGARTYTVDEMVVVTCTATDAGTGVQSTTCGATPLLQSPAWMLPLGTTTVTATATDYTGKTTTASASVNVVVTYASLAAVAGTFGDALGQSLQSKVRAAAEAAARGNAGAAAQMLAAFEQEVLAQSGKGLTAGQAEALVRLARALVP